MKKLFHKSLGSSVLAAGAALALIASGVVLGALPASATPPLTTLQLIGSPVTSDSGNSYVVTIDSTTGDMPTGVATVSDNAGDGGSCSITGPSDWGIADSDGSADGFYYSGVCDITTPEVAGALVTATYSGGDYSALPSSTLAVGPATAVLILQATNPVTGSNLYGVDLELPTDIAPSGTVTISDGGDSCTAGTGFPGWIPEGTDGYGDGHTYAGLCSIPQGSGGETVTATYNGSDYTAVSNALTIGPATAILALSGTPVAGSGNTFTVELTTPTAIVPIGVATVSDPPGGSTCQASAWLNTSFNGGGSENYTATCVISTPESTGDTVSAIYNSTDYTTSTSNELVVGVPASISSVTVAGSPIVGSVLTATANDVVGSPTPTATYQWYDGSTAITGAVSATYTVASSDLGDSLSVTVTETNGIGSSASASSTGTTTVTAPQTNYQAPPTTPPTIPPVTPPTSPPLTPPVTVPAPANFGFSANSATLGSGARARLNALARKLESGSRVTVTGYAKGDTTLARRRADAVMAYLKVHAPVTVTVHVRTAASRKVTVVTTKN
jgi:outer membrane protein OmpA-like peptidoglycan-associated protein